MENFTSFFTDTIIKGNSVLDYLISLGIFVLAIVLGRLVVWVGNTKIKKKVEATPTAWDNILFNVFQTPFVCILVIAVLWLAISRLDYSDKTADLLAKIYRVLIIVNVTWVLSRLVKTICEFFLMPMVTKGNYGNLDKNVVLTIQKTASTLIWILGVTMAIESMGVNIATLLTTLGIGGVAVALAAQDTVKNIIGGITVYIDRTFRIGDRIKVGSFDGFVEDIGMRSTRIRTLEGFLITIPNSQVVEGAVQNVSKEPSRKIALQLGLTYDTTPEKMVQAMEILKKTPEVIKDIQKDVVVSFTAFADSSLGITFAYFIRKNKDFFAVQNDVNMYILREFNAAGLEFAFPSQTVYLANEPTE